MRWWESRKSETLKSRINSCLPLWKYWVCYPEFGQAVYSYDKLWCILHLMGLGCFWWPEGLISGITLELRYSKLFGHLDFLYHPSIYWESHAYYNLGIWESDWNFFDTTSDQFINSYVFCYVKHLHMLPQAQFSGSYCRQCYV